MGFPLPVPDFVATDADLKGEMTYRVISDGLASVFFDLNANNQPVVRNRLVYAPNNEYTVSANDFFFK